MVYSVYLDAENTDKLPEYNTLDINLRYEYKWLSVYLSMDNLFNKKYNSYWYKKSDGVKYFSPAPGRTSAVGVEMKF